MMAGRTPEFVGLDVPLPRLAESFGVAVRLVDDLRACARRYTGRDGYLAVSDGRYNPCPTWDPRDYDHINRVAAYLWGMEPELDAQISANIFADQLDAQDGHLRPAFRQDQRAIHLGQWAKYAADRFLYAATPEHLAAHWERAVQFVRWAFAAYDPQDSGMLDQISATATGEGGLQTFWGFFVGEPAHFPFTLSPHSKPVGVAMTLCGLLAAMARFGAAHDLPDTESIRRRAERLRRLLETDGYSERRGYYYLQRDEFQRQWYFSLNGQCEDSRELFVTPYYADEIGADPERARAVARVVHRVLHDCHEFPAPITYPRYRWYGASPECHFHAFGMDRFLFGGCWDSPYASCVGLLATVGLLETVVEAVGRRSEAICRDGDCLEWYYPDGTTGEHGTGATYHRDRYGISATAHIVAIVEGLFGIRPAAPGFGVVRIEPAFPFRRDAAQWAALRARRPGTPPFAGWRHSSPNPWLDRPVGLTVTLPGGRRFAWSCCRDTHSEEIRLTGSAVGATAQYRIPVEEETAVVGVEQGGKPLEFALDRRMDTDFVRFACPLDGTPATIRLRRRE